MAMSGMMSQSSRKQYDDALKKTLTTYHEWQKAVEASGHYFPISDYNPLDAYPQPKE